MKRARSTDPIDLIPSEFHLSQNSPNPFSEKTTIKFCLAYKARVKLEVFDAERKVAKTLVDEEREAGTYEIEIDATSLPGGGLGPSEGIYGYQLRAGHFSVTKKMVFLNLSQ